MISSMLEAQGLKVEEKYWPYLLKFAEREGAIDYKFLLDVYKGKTDQIKSHPRFVLNWFQT